MPRGSVVAVMAAMAAAAVESVFDVAPRVNERAEPGVGYVNLTLLILPLDVYAYGTKSQRYSHLVCNVFSTLSRLHAVHEGLEPSAYNSRL